MTNKNSKIEGKSGFFKNLGFLTADFTDYTDFWGKNGD